MPDTTIKLEDVKPGDTVAVRMIVQDIDCDRLSLRAGLGEISIFRVPLASIASHTPAPRPIEVGCEVKHPYLSLEWSRLVVLAIDGKQTWLRVENGPSMTGWQTAKMSDLTCVSP